MVVVTYKDLVEGVGKNTREVKVVVVESEHNILEEVVKMVVVVVVKVKAEVVMAVAVEEVEVSKLVAEVAVILMEGVVKNTWEVKVVVVVVESKHGILEDVVVKVAVVKVVALKEEVEVSKLVVEVAVMVMLEAKKEQRDDI